MEAVTRGDYESVKQLVIYHWGSINRTEPQQGNSLLAICCREVQCRCYYSHMNDPQPVF